MQLVDRRLRKLLLAAVATVFVFSTCYLLVGYRRPPQSSGTGRTDDRKPEDPLETVRATLAKETDLTSCRNALQQLNLYLQQRPDTISATLTPDELTLLSKEFGKREEDLQDPKRASEWWAAYLREKLGLDQDEISEVQSTVFTPLDAHQLDQCFLLKDVARSLNVERLKPLQRAEAAFAFVVRQVRLREGSSQASVADVPPQFVLRRGWGSSPERAMLFLALLRQLGLKGCMIACPADAVRLEDLAVLSGISAMGLADLPWAALLRSSLAEPPRQDPTAWRYWLPGVVIERQIYLFDPRLGLPLPGPNGQGIATLEQARQQAHLLGQLTIDRTAPYDITPLQAAQAEVHAAFALSDLVPRLRWLQDVLAPGERDGPAGIKLADNPAAMIVSLDRIAPSPSGSGVRTWNGSLRSLRQFLPREEGGADASSQAGKPNRRDVYLLEMLPLYVLPEPIRKVPGRPGKLMLDTFGNQFLLFVLEPRMPRDLALRGRYDEAAAKLVDVLDRVRDQRSVIAAQANLEQQAFQWCDAIRDVEGALLRTEAEAAVKNPQALEARRIAHLRQEQLLKDNQAVLLYLEKLSSEPRMVDAMYLLALCKHEQAERAQARLEAYSGNRPQTADLKASQDAWKAAAERWRQFLEERSRGPYAAAARLARARALAALGQREAAIALLENLADVPDPFEKAGRLLLAQRLRTFRPDGAGSR